MDFTSRTQATISFMDMYIGGSTLYAFDLTPDMAASWSHIELVKNRNICLELHFATPITETINVIIYVEFENLLQIDRDVNVLTDF